MNEEDFIKKFGPLTEEFRTLYKLSEKLLEKARNGEFESDMDAFKWIEAERKKAGYPYSDQERARMIHVAEQADAQRKLNEE